MSYPTAHQAWDINRIASGRECRGMGGIDNGNRDVIERVQFDEPAVAVF